VSALRPQSRSVNLLFARVPWNCAGLVVDLSLGLRDVPVWCVSRNRMLLETIFVFVFGLLP
jgi:hypothetical protein